MTLLSFLGQVTCMKLVQRAGVTTVSMCLCGMALMTKVGVSCPFPLPRCLLVLLQSQAKSAFLSTGYKHLFQPVINQVVDYYQPTCIVLQVRKCIHLFEVGVGCSQCSWGVRVGVSWPSCCPYPLVNKDGQGVGILLCVWKAMPL